MDFVWSSAAKDIRRHLRDPAAFLLWLGIPIAIATILSLAMGGRSARTPQAILLVHDADSSFVSRLVTSAFSQGQLADLIHVEAVALEEGRTRIHKGDGSAFLVIPKGFADSLLADRPDTLRLLTNPAQRVLPGIIEETLGMLVDGTFYLQQVGTPIREQIRTQTQEDRDPTDVEVSSISVLVNQLLTRTRGYLFPPRIELEYTEEVEEKGTRPENYGIIMFPGILFMSLLFMAQGMSGDIWQERSQGTLRRVLTTPRRIASFLAGKVLAGAALMAAVSAVGALLGTVFFGLPLAQVPLGVVWATFSGTMLLTLLLLLQLLAGSETGANLLTTLVIFPLMMLGGSFFPFEAMPEWMARIGRWTPNGWALEQLKAILLGRAETGPLLTAFTGLVAFGIVLFFASTQRLERGFAKA